ncbi:MAG: beta strand repeat-containing protein [Janthinobacterium lividum]
MPTPRNASTTPVGCAVDNTPPVFATGSPSANAVTATGFTLSSTINETGTTYYVVVPDNATAPTAVQVKAGQNASGMAATPSGSLANPTANTAATTTVAGLTASTSYDVYVVAQDAATTPNLQASVVKLDITTVAPGATLTVTPTSLNIFGARTGAPSAAQNYALKGSNLSADVVVTAPNGYEVSLDNAMFAGSVTAAAATVQTTNGQLIYVRLTGAAGTYGTSTTPVNVTNTSMPTTGTATTANEQVYGATIMPTLTASPTSRSGFTYVQGNGPSGIQSYTLNYTDAPTFAGTITATASASYELSISSTFATTLASPYIISYTGTGASQSTTLYVRLKAGLTAAGSPYNETITNDNTALSLSAPVAVSGTVTPPPAAITVTPITALSFATTTGTPSAEQNYAVSGANLTTNLTVTAPAAYEISLTSSIYTGTGGNTLTLTPSSGTVASTTIYVRLTGAAAGTFNGTVSNASTGATARTIAVSGTVTAPVAPALATYSLAALTTGRAPMAPATAKDPNINTAADLTRGPGINNSSGSTSADIFGATGWGTVANLATAQMGDKYFAFAITPVFGYLINVTSVGGNAFRTSTAPSTIELLYSTNSDFSNPVSLGTQTITSTLAPGAAFSFSSVTMPQNVAGPIYFRIYGYGSTSSSANFYFSENGNAPGLVVNGTTALTTTPLIATNAINPMAICGGSNIVVNYATAGPASTGTYAVQLSDASGSFATPTTLTTVSSTSSSITVNVPSTTANGTSYKMRVVNTDGTIGMASAVLTVVSNPTAVVAPASAQTINSGTTGTILTVTETPAGTSRQWAYATTPGGSYTPISGATGLTYTPNFSAVGTYYVVAQSTFAACATVTSNEVMVTVTTPTLVATPTALTGFGTTAGSVSAAQTYVLMGTGVSAPIMVTAPTGYEVSLDGATFTTSVPVSAGNANAGQTIYVRLTGSAVGNASGTISNMVGTVTANVNVSGTVAVSSGVLLAEDNFDYNGALNANGWQDTGTSVTQPGNITADMYPQGILATGGTSYQASIVGKSGSMLYRQATIPSGTTALYAAALINVTNASTVSGDDFIFAFQTVSGGTSARGRVTIARPNSSLTTKFVLRLQASDATSPATNSTQFDLNTPYILVLKAESSSVTTNSTDQYSLYLLPATANLSQEPSTPLLRVNGASFSTVGAFQIRMSDSNNPNLYLDNFRFATGWGAAVGNVMYSAAASTINAGNYYNLMSGNNGQVTQNGAVTVENQLALATGQLALNGQRLTLAGTLTGTGTLTGSAASNLVVLGTGALGTLNFTAGTQLLNNLTLNRTNIGTVTLGSPLTVGGTLALTSGNLITSTTNLLTLPSAATLTGGSATSFINGPLARGTNAGAATTVFPIGKGMAYRPLTLNATQQGNAVTYRAEQFEGNPGQAGTDPAATDGTTLTRVSQVRSFTLTPYSGSTVTQPTNFQGTVTLSFGADDQVTDPTLPTFVMGKRADASSLWTNIGGSGSGSASGGTLTSSSFTSFSDFALASTDPVTTNNPLPVSLTKFTAARAAAGVQVAWATASEKNSDYFVVERSLDGSTFSSVTKVAAHGTTTQSHTYASLDGMAPAALLYYRLRQVDLDGTVAYSPVVSVAADGTASEFTLAPNPAHERVSFLTALPTAYTVRNTLGQIVRSGTTEAGTNNLAVEELPAGIYFFELHGGAGRVVRKFVKE